MLCFCVDILHMEITRQEQNTRFLLYWILAKLNLG